MHSVLHMLLIQFSPSQNYIMMIIMTTVMILKDKISAWSMWSCLSQVKEDKENYTLNSNYKYMITTTI